jgi:hypothetical protein
VNGATLEHSRAGALQAVEGGRWLLTLAGILGDHPPTDPDGFLGFARSLQFPEIYEAIHDAEPLDDPVAFRFPASVRRRYERLTRFPDGLLLVGDAICSFNPAYGQGMSVAALQALNLRRHLERTGEPDPHRFFRDLARLIDVAWDIAVGGDLAFPSVEGRRTLKIRLLNAYLTRLLAAAADDAASPRHSSGWSASSTDLRYFCTRAGFFAYFDTGGCKNQSGPAHVNGWTDRRPLASGVNYRIHGASTIARSSAPTSRPGIKGCGPISSPIRLEGSSQSGSSPSPGWRASP